MIHRAMHAGFFYFESEGESRYDFSLPFTQMNSNIYNVISLSEMAQANHFNFANLSTSNMLLAYECYGESKSKRN